MEPWLNLLQTFGLAVTILAAMMFAVWRVAGWLGRELVIPMRDQGLARFVKFLDKMDETMSRLERTSDRIVTAVDELLAAKGEG